MLKKTGVATRIMGNHSCETIQDINYLEDYIERNGDSSSRSTAFRIILKQVTLL